MALIRLSVSERRKITIFLTCLLLAIGAWLFFALSNKYQYQLKTIVSFKDPPLNKAFNPLQSDTVVLNIEGTGWELVFNRMRLYPKNVKISLKQLSNKNYVTFSEQLNNVNREYSLNQKIISVQPDTLYFDFTSREVKRVPIKLNSKLSFINNQYSQSSVVKLTPSYVTITGPKQVLKNITKWETDTLKAENIKETFSKIIGLKPHPEANVTIIPGIVKATVPVDEFTEKLLLIPIKVINNPLYEKVKLVPEKVKVSFMVSLTDYSKFVADDFTATVDLSLWKKFGARQLPVVVKKKNPFIKIKRIEPLQVNFMVTK